jgi:N-acetylmuramoyl-L-alanine amidase
VTSEEHVPPNTTRRTIVIAVVVVAAVIAALAAFAATRKDDSTAAPKPASSSASQSAAATPTSVPTASSEDSAASSGSLAGKVIVLDPGHNEHNAQHTAEINQLVDVITEKKPCDTTGTETNDGFTEAAFNTDVANRVASILRDDGATVILTRDANTPWGPCITERAAIGNNAHADAAISIHADGGPADGHGFDMIEPSLVAGHNDAIIAPSHQLALDVRDAYASATGLPFANYVGNEGIDNRDDLGGLNLSTVPKVFIECANMRNASDAKNLEDPDFRQKIAVGIAQGLETFVRSQS